VQAAFVSLNVYASCEFHKYTKVGRTSRSVNMKNGELLDHLNELRLLKKVSVIYRK
jgi:hypothetical protein